MKCTPDETGRCTTCGDMLTTPGKTSDADRIAQLTTDLERTKAERDQWEHEARSNAAKLVGEMRQRSEITELKRQVERLQAEVIREREGFTKRRRDKAQQWRNLEAQRDADRAQLTEAWKALGTTAEEAADDPDTAALSDSIRVSLQYERDKVDQAREHLDAVRDERDQERARLSAIEITLNEGIAASQVQRGDYAHTRELDLVRALVEKAGLLDAPEIQDFARAVVLEAAHQRARWSVDHDAGKTDADWFWLIGYLAGKALHNPGGEHDKQLHRIITVAAAACNWHAAKLGKTNMRPGIEPPAALEKGGA